MKTTIYASFFLSVLGAASICASAASADQAAPSSQQMADANNFLYDHDYDTTPNAYQQRYGAPYSSPSPQSSFSPLQNAPTAGGESAGGSRAELDISTIYDNDPSSDVNGGSSFGLDTTLYSATIDQKWRLFAGEFYSHENEPLSEGHINYSRSMAGVEYNYNDLLASVAPTYNHYNDNERVGAAGAVTWDATQNWAFGGGAQLFSRDVPLRALNAGITANSYNLNAGWYQQDIRTIRVDADAMNFSDGNMRTQLSGADTEHLYVSNRFTFDGLVNLSESQNSDNEGRPYYNPGQDFLGLIGGRLGQPLYKGYGFTYDHSLEVKPGFYAEREYGASPAITAGYTQHVAYKDDVDGSLGVIFTREDADGTPENDLAVLLNVSKKF